MSHIPQDRGPEAESLLPDTNPPDDSQVQDHPSTIEQPLKSLEYWTFLVIGVSYLWPWNCFLAASAYFNQRFGDAEFMKANFNSFMMTISTITSTTSSLILADRQQKADYSRRVVLGELLIAGVFVLMAISCVVIVPNWFYFMFLMGAIFVSSLGTALAQNGSFAVVNSINPVYTQAIMVGQAVSGILPPIISIITAFFTTTGTDSTADTNKDNKQGDGNSSSSSPPPPTTAASSQAGHSAAYFLVSTLVAGLAIALYYATVERTGYRSHDRNSSLDNDDGQEQEDADSKHKKHFSLLVLLNRLAAPTFAVFMTFTITLVYPVFAANVKSVSGLDDKYFLPIVFLTWNFGDLMGRIVCGYPSLVVKSSNMFVGYALMRLIFIPAYFLCNIKGHAIVDSDVFYIVLQFLFGLSNGHLGSSAMMSPPDYVDEEQKEAAGGFMTLALSLGLSAGSLLSFVFVALVQ